MANIAVSKDMAGIRLDVFLAKEFFSMSRGEIARHIKEKNILVNKKPIKPSYRLREGDEIKSEISFVKETLHPNAQIKIPIVYEDDDLIVVNKPAGIQVHPSSTEKKDTLVNALLAKFPEITNVHDDSLGAEFRPGIVHRLDKDTSGLMLVARSKKAFEELAKLFEERKVQKKYLALVCGKLKNRRGIITKPIARAANYRKQVIAGRKTKTKIRGAVTKYKVLKTFPNYSLVEVMPLTGRMHQIRIHFFSIGHPVAGDKLYKIKHPESRQAPIPSRQLLHAKQLAFNFLGKRFSFEAKMPPDFASFIRNID